MAILRREKPHHNADQNDDRGGYRAAEARHERPDLVEFGELTQTVFALAFEVAQTAERQQYRQQDQVGQDRDRDADRGGNRELENDANRNDQDRRKTNATGNQRDRTGHQQRPKCTYCGSACIHAVTCTQLLDAAFFEATEKYFATIAIDHLLAMTHRYSEDQKRRQHVHRINAEAEQAQHAEHPQHRNKRTEYRQ